MSAPYVPGSPHELIGYLVILVEHAAKDYPNDPAFARGVAAYEAFKASRDSAPVSEPTNPDRRCRNCGATSGLKMLHGNPLICAPREWECWDNCRDSAR